MGILYSALNTENPPRKWGCLQILQNNGINELIQKRGKCSIRICCLRVVFVQQGGHLNINMWSYQYNEYHVKDKTVARPSCLWEGNPHTSERRSLYWDRVPERTMTSKNFFTDGWDNVFSPVRCRAHTWTNHTLLDPWGKHQWNSITKTSVQKLCFPKKCWP